MRCEAIDCIHNEDGYCVDDSYVEIDHAGECKQFEYKVAIVSPPTLFEQIKRALPDDIWERRNNL